MAVLEAWAVMKPDEVGSVTVMLTTTAETSVGTPCRPATWNEIDRPPATRPEEDRVSRNRVGAMEPAWPGYVRAACQYPERYVLPRYRTPSRLKWIRSPEFTVPALERANPYRRRAPAFPGGFCQC